MFAFVRANACASGEPCATTQETEAKTNNQEHLPSSQTHDERGAEPDVGLKLHDEAEGKETEEESEDESPPAHEEFEAISMHRSIAVATFTEADL